MTQLPVNTYGFHTTNATFIWLGVMTVTVTSLGSNLRLLNNLNPATATKQTS